MKVPLLRPQARAQRSNRHLPSRASLWQTLANFPASASPGEKLLEGQVIQLEDGTTAYIHQVTIQKGEVPQHTPCAGGSGSPHKRVRGHELQRRTGLALLTESFSFEDGQPVQLEDGSMAYIHHTPKGGPMGVMAGGEGRDRPGRGLGVSTSTLPLPGDTTLLAYPTFPIPSPGKPQAGAGRLEHQHGPWCIITNQGKETHSSLTEKEALE